MTFLSACSCEQLGPRILFELSHNTNLLGVAHVGQSPTYEGVFDDN